MNQLKLWLAFACSYGSLLTWTLNSWISIWMVMEIMVLFLVGLLSLDVSYSSSSLMMKYFIVQLLVSLMFMIFGLVYFMNLFMGCGFICFILLMAKLGFFPFHFWLVNVVGKLGWLSFIILNTAVKLPPLNLSLYLMETSHLGAFLLSSTLVGSFLGINNVVIQKMLMYSSLTHLCWILMSLSLSLSVYWMYFMSYIVTMTVLGFSFSSAGSFYMNQFKMCSFSSLSSLFLVFMILSLAGFPPFLGFVMKWILASFMFFCNLKFMIFMVIFCSFLSVVFYIQLSFFFLLMVSSNLKFYYSKFLSGSAYLIGFFILSFYLFIHFFF